MHKRAVCLVVLGAVMLTACSSKQDANEKNFGTAISQYLDKKGALCLQLTQWPLDVSENNLASLKTIPTGPAGKMAALEAAGLVSATDAVIEGTSFYSHEPNGLKFKVKRYALTDAGKKFYVEHEVSENPLAGIKKGMQGDICYGKKSLDKVVKWEGPVKLGDYQEARVNYLYKIDSLAEWTKSAAFQEAFPAAGRIIAAAGKGEQAWGVKLTNQGWEALGL